MYMYKHVWYIIIYNVYIKGCYFLMQATEPSVFACGLCTEDLNAQSYFISTCDL